MKDRIVPQEEIDNGYIVFCKDLGAEGKTKEDIDKYLKEHDIVVKQKEDKKLIWFEQIEDGEVKYYSKPIEKYISEPEKEIMFCIKVDGPVGMISIPESAMPTRQFSEKRQGKITPAEEKRNERESNRRWYQWRIDECFEHSVFGYILFNGKTINYPDIKYSTTILEYRGNDNYNVEHYNDTELMKELLSNKDRYTWYNLNDNEYFIVRNSKKTEYQYLADEKTQEIKLAKIVANKIVLEDIIKDELTLKVEKEIDKYLSQSDIVVYDRYIRYRNHGFEIVKTEKVPITVKKEKFELFPKPDYRTEGKYQRFETELSLSDIEKVVKNGSKYKRFEYHGALYISSKIGSSRFKIIVGDYIDDYFNTPECHFVYNNSPEDMVLEFIKNGVWDGDKIIEKYNCSQESINNITRDLIRCGRAERNEDDSNKYKLIPHREDLSEMIFYIEHELHL